MKVLFLTKYDRKAASTRYRHEQYLPILRANGIEGTIAPLLSDEYLKDKFATGRASLGHVIGAFCRRIRDLWSARNYDLVVIHCEIFPYFPAVVERFLNFMKVPYFYDFDDAIFHQYDLHRRPLIRMLLGNKIAKVIRGAEAVLAGNSYLANYARRTNKNVHIFPTVVDVERYRPKGSSMPHERFTIGWLGSPSTARYVKDREVALRTFCSRHDAQLLLVGSGPISMKDVPTVIHEWSEESEIQELMQFDVGIMPITEDPWARGKCGFKLIQYMAAKIPVIASPVGVNADIVTPGRDGYLATTDQEWVQAFEAILADPERGRKMGESGSQKVQAAFSLQVMGPKLVDLIKSSRHQAPFQRSGCRTGAAASSQPPSHPAQTGRGDRWARGR